VRGEISLGFKVGREKLISEETIPCNLPPPLIHSHTPSHTHTRMQSLTFAVSVNLSCSSIICSTISLESPI